MADNSKTIKINLADGKDEDSDDEVAKAASRLAGSPLFGDVEDPKAVQHVSVIRNGPVPEGGLGRFPVSISEEDIRNRFGGGTYTVQAKDAQGQVMKGGTRTVEIAGAPLFQSKEARLRYGQYMANLSDTDVRPEAERNPLGSNLSEVFTLISTLTNANEDKARLAHERQLALLREEGKQRERQLEAEAQRAREEARDRADRAEKESKERYERDREYQASQAERDRQFMVMMAQQKGGGNQLNTFLEGIKFADKAGGGGDGDWLDEIAKALAPALAGKIGVSNEEGPKPAAEAAPAKQIQRAAPTEKADQPKAVTLKGPLGEKAEAVLAKIQAAGGNPAAILEGMFDRLDHQVTKAQNSAANAVSRETPPAAPQAPDGGDGSERTAEETNVLPDAPQAPGGAG